MKQSRQIATRYSAGEYAELLARATQDKISLPNLIRRSLGLPLARLRGRPYKLAPLAAPHEDNRLAFEAHVRDGDIQAAEDSIRLDMVSLGARLAGAHIDARQAVLYLRHMQPSDDHITRALDDRDML